MFVAAVLLCFESIWHASSSVVGMINGLIFFLADSSRLILRILMEPFFQSQRAMERGNHVTILCQATFPI